MKNKPSLLLLLSVCLSLCSVAQERLWKDLSPTDPGMAQQSREKKPASPWPGKHRLVKLNSAIARQLQQLAPLENSMAPFPVTVVPFGIPLPEGGLHQDIITESPVLTPEMQTLYPSIKTYRLRDERTKKFTGRITITPDGVSGLIFTDSGAAYISRAPEYGAEAHVVYYVKDIQLPATIRCDVLDELIKTEVNDAGGTGPTPGGDCQLRTYRVAVSATGEYTQWAGSVANAVSAITSTINDVSAIYERDATIKFVLANINNAIYSNADSDPFPTVDFPDLNMLNANHSALVANIGSSNFDVGMVFNKGWSGGLARLNSACQSSSKGCNAAGISFGTGANPAPGPQGPIFTGTVAHEIGHQFSATHSFAATNDQCNGNATVQSAWEPGGGSTIMAYAGSCAGNSYQNNSDLYFHGGNIEQITNYAINNGTCAAISPTSNTPPVVSLTGNSYTIPPGTPFELTAQASDASLNLLYNWEQMDAGPLTNSKPSASTASGPQFRSFPPNGNPGRVFPNISAVVGNINPDYEVLPSVARIMKFRVTVRDAAPGGGCYTQANVTVTTAGVTPFKVGSQNTATTWTANGTNTATIEWNPGTSDQAPVNCTAVNILFSVDGGFTYPYTLASGVPNNGSAQVIIPNLATNTGRVRVQAVNNIFFDINNANITIITSCAAEGAVIVPADAVSANAGDPALNLNLSASFGTLINNFSGQLTSTDPKASLVFNNVSVGNCQTASNTYQYDRYKFMVNKAGNYTFTIPANTHPAVMNLYQGSYDPANPCNNFLNSTGTRGPTNVFVDDHMVYSLVPGIYYELTVGTFGNNNPALPLSYIVTVTNNAGGNMYNGYPSPGAGFNYTYVIVNNTTGKIKAFVTDANLSNQTNYPPGSYSVYGLSYANSITAATLNSYIDNAFMQFQQAILNNPGTLCSNLSGNAVQVIIKGDGPPPLLPLSAVIVNDDVVLKWGTQREDGVSHFEIHRSTDGSNFTKLPGQVNAKGFSTTQTDYTYTDNAPANGPNYYRVRQVNLDNQQLMSTIVRAERVDMNSELKLYPNPLKNQPLFVEYITNKREEIRIMITDSKGSVIRSVMANTRPGTNQYRFDIPNLARGLYFVTIKRADGTIADRFLKN